MKFSSPYFGQTEIALLRVKQSERRSHIRTSRALEEALEHRALSDEEQMERFFTALSSRLLRAKYHSSPHYSNEELAYLVGCPSGTYLGQIMMRKRSCSKPLATLMCNELRKLEMSEGMTPMYQPEWPEEDS